MHPVGPMPTGRSNRARHAGCPTDTKRRVAAATITEKFVDVRQWPLARRRLLRKRGIRYASAMARAGAEGKGAEQKAALFEVGMRHFRAGRFAQAEEKCRQA